MFIEIDKAVPLLQSETDYENLKFQYNSREICSDQKVLRWVKIALAE